MVASVIGVNDMCWELISRTSTRVSILIILHPSFDTVVRAHTEFSQKCLVQSCRRRLVGSLPHLLKQTVSAQRIISRSVINVRCLVEYADLPIIDFAKLATRGGSAMLAQQVHHAMTTSGFFYVINHGHTQAQVGWYGRSTTSVSER